MRRLVEEADRGLWTLLPECLNDFIDESNPVRVIDVFVNALDLAEMSFKRVEPATFDLPPERTSSRPVGMSQTCQKSNLREWRPLAQSCRSYLKRPSELVTDEE